MTVASEGRASDGRGLGSLLPGREVVDESVDTSDANVDGFRTCVGLANVSPRADLKAVVLEGEGDIDLKGKSWPGGLLGNGSFGSGA